MDRSVVYLFIDGSWLYGADYHPASHAAKGKYAEVVFARGWSSREITECLREYYDENYTELFE